MPAPNSSSTIDRSREIPVELRSAPIVSHDAENRTIDVVWTTGFAGDRIDWETGQRYVEELVVSDSAVRLGLLNSGAAVLDSHDRYSGIRGILAVIERAWIEDGKGLARVRFPKAGIDPDLDITFAKIADGIIRSLSCGYRRHKIEVDRSKTPQVWRVIDWEPFEISFVAVPFDPGAQVRSDDKANRHRCEFVQRSDASRAGVLARMRMRQRVAGF